MPVSAISTSGLTVDYDGAEVLKDIEFSVRQQKLTAIVGPNGAGKSTLIKAMLGLIPIRTGSTTFFDLPLKKFQKNISYVPQRAQIDWEFPASVFDVVAMGLYSELGCWMNRLQELMQNPSRLLLIYCVDKRMMGNQSLRYITTYPRSKITLMM